MATRTPKSAGYQSPIFLSEGENTPGKLNTIQMNPSIHTVEINPGRFMAAPCISTNYES